MSNRQTNSQAVIKIPDFRRNFLSLLVFVLAGTWGNTALAATQTVNGGATFTAITSGDNYLFQNQVVLDATLDVSAGVNLGSDVNGYSVTSTATPNRGVVNFSGNSIVAGQIGTGPTSQTLNFINTGAPGTSVTFNSNVAAPLHYQNNNSTVILAPGVTYTGAATTTAAGIPTGFLVLNNGSNYVGAIGDATNFVNTIALPTGNASITGAVASQNFVLGPNTLIQTGAVTFPVGAQLTTTVLSQTVFGRINAPSLPNFAVNFTPGLQVNVLIDSTVVLTPGVPLQVVTGTGGGSAPITVTSNNVRFTFTGLNPAGTGNVLIFPTLVPPVIPPGPAGGAAAAFDAGIIGATGDFLYVQQLVTALNNLEAIGAAIAQFAPTVNGGNAFMSFAAVNRFQNNWQSNLNQARSANMCYPNDCAPKCESPCETTACNTHCLSPCAPCDENADAWNGEGLWLDGFGSSAKQGLRSQIEGYRAKMYGGTLAMQKPITRNWQVGLGTGYAYTDVNGKGIQRNGTHINTTEGTFYLGYNCGSWFLDNFFTYAWNQYKGYRHIAFPGLDRTARAKYHGQTYSNLLSGGYNYFIHCGFTLTPLASLQYMKLHINGYTEKDAISLNLVQNAQRYEVLQSGLGLMLGHTAPSCYGNLFTEVHSKWLHDLHDKQINNTSRYSGGGPAFNTLGVLPFRNQINLGVSTTLFTACDVALKASYELNYGSKFMSYEGRATVAYLF